ncbi:TPM domain-containing protein [Moraxella sp. ZJ142]|uniref:TPM domain-containing protein n=1 Tax=Moraxella marmotae TaxID=3344520 RepID=UPI0035D44CA2
MVMQNTHSTSKNSNVTDLNGNANTDLNQSPNSKPSKNATKTPQNSVARWLRQLLYIPFLHNRWLTQAVKDSLSDAIMQAERGHRGEIYLIIENQLPLATAYAQDCHERALHLFATHRVWDTQDNTGILVYVNLCEHQLQIVADRGIDQIYDNWQPLCDQALSQFRQGQIQTGLNELIAKLGELLLSHYPADDVSGNELPNQVKHL